MKGKDEDETNRNSNHQREQNLPWPRRNYHDEKDSEKRYKFSNLGAPPSTQNQPHPPAHNHYQKQQYPHQQNNPRRMQTHSTQHNFLPAGRYFPQSSSQPSIQRFHNNQRFIKSKSHNLNRQNDQENYAGVSKMRSSDISPDVQRVWDNILKWSKQVGRSRETPIDSSKPEEIRFWNQVWIAAGSGAGSRDHVMSLPAALLKLPDLTLLFPSPDEVVRVLVELLTLLINGSYGISVSSNACMGVTTLETVIDVVKKRLMNHLEPAIIAPLATTVLELLSKLSESYKQAINKILSTSSSDFMERIGILLSRGRDITQYRQEIERIVQNSQLIHNTNDSFQQGSESSSWKSPTLLWLLSGDWHRVGELRTCYASPDEYAHAMESIWTLLAFYWGAAAVWPRCSHQQQQGGEAKVCGEPLLASASSKALCCVRNKGQLCGRSAIWSCHRRGHQDICSRCLQHQQAQLIGPSGPHASTDIYDAVVDRETDRREGVVYMLSSVTSRRPPKIPPNWRTSYRLQPSALVGVIKLATQSQRLSPSSIVQWAEVVPVTPQNGLSGDWKYRQEGRMAIRLLSRGDCAALSNDADNPLERRCHLAVIDLRVFVPEVISVLSTISSDAFANHLSQISFAGRLIGQNGELSLYNYESRSSVAENVSRAIECSEIDFIRRLDPHARANMVNQICAIPQVQSLYGTQLEAFCGALASSIHCTQGPPGTGKSYIGVCLVLALDVVRTTALKFGKSVGPILVLSYKNHALDEFLCDVLRFSHMKTGMLIRTGKAESAELSSFSEKFSPQEQSAQEELTRRVSTLRSARTALAEWRSVSASLKFTLPENYSARLAESWQLTIYQALQLLQLFPECQSIDVMPSSRKAYEFISNALVVRDPAVIQKTPPCAETLLMEAEHWNTKASLLWLWLDGLNPPPRCGAVLGNGDVQCLECTQPSWNYCDKFHRCLSRMRAEPCQELRNHSSVPYCDQHICDASYTTKEPCAYERTQHSSFCENHSCPCCVLLLSSSSEILVGAKMPFSCAIHKCVLCPSAQLFPHKFCASHLCEECGVSGNITNSPKVAYSKYCTNHKCVFEACLQKRNSVQSNGNLSLYCSAHSCILCRQIGKSTSVVFESRFCKDHVCQHVDDNTICVKRRMECSMYCVSHTCRICSATDIFPPLGPVREPKPRNVCMEHPLCSKVFRHGGLCTEVAIPPLLMYCVDHTQTVKKKEELKGKANNVLRGDGQCNGIAKTTKQRCKAKGSSADGGRWWCDAHSIQKKLQIEKEKAELSDDEDENEDLVADLKEPATDEDEDEDDASLSDMSDEDDGGVSNPARNVTEFFLKRCCAENNGHSCQVQKWTESNYIYERWFCWIHTNHEGEQERSMIYSDVSRSVFANTNATLHEAASEPDATKTNLDISVLQLMEAVAIVEAEKENPWESYEGLSQDDKDLPLPEFVDAVAVDIHPDELDAYNDDNMDGDSQDGNDDLNRLRDMMDQESDCESEEGYSSVQFLDDKEKEDTNNKADDMETPAEWSWSFSHSKRLELVSCFLSKMSTALTVLRKAADDHVAEARKMKNEAGSLVFRGARVVGATVVGASRRLEAIRAAEPFAVLVEEACEVMEPTLVSVLAVKSLQKLELIGDHRQLPAFVQNCWFNLETTLPSIKTSLFERLISGRVHSRNRKRLVEEITTETVPFAILDEQRRMRSCIADITRPDYADIVNVLDHPHTKQQLVGDRVRSTSEKSQLIQHRTLWPKNFRGIPGVAVPLFFWNLEDNREGRPVAGLSACNPTEASAVVAVTKWLLICGVPASCISIITPYKGQKTEIISQLRKAKCLPGFQHHGHQSNYHGSRSDNVEAVAEDVVTVSTVDRFQGDENDIVILSLVKTQPGNRFVALKNRFIVAVSRARMGFYVVGSVHAVVKDRGGAAGPEHWNRFVSGLEEQKGSTASAVNLSTLNAQLMKGERDVHPCFNKDASDSFLKPSGAKMIENSSFTENDKNSERDILSVSSIGKEFPVSSDSQVGISFPVCCPRHHTSSTRLIDAASKFPTESNWGEFCKEKCSFKIPACGHECVFPCHSPTVMPHTTQSNCRTTIERPCDLHSDIPLFCCEVWLPGKVTLADALIKFKCSVRVKYSRPECNHVVEVECHQYQGILNGTYRLPNCEVSVADFINPMCNHISKHPTCTRRREWEKNPPQCCVSVLYRKPCGCTDKVQCWEHIKFMSMQSLPVCQHDVEKRRPRCGHKLSLRCYIASKMDDLWNDHNGQTAYDADQRDNARLLVQFGIPYGESESKLLDGSESITTKIPKCMVPVSYKSKCGHTVDAPCSIAFDMAYGVIEEVKCNCASELYSPFCGHNVNVPCWAGSILSSLRLWLGNPFPSGATAIECNISESQLSAVGQAMNNTESGVPLKVRKLFGKVCSRSITIVRNCGREHNLKIRCSNLLQMLLSSGPNGILYLPDCEDNVERLLPCDHTTFVPCHKLHDNPPPVCLTPVKSRFVFPCGVHSVANEPCNVYAQLCNTTDLKCKFSATVNRYRCKHSVDIPCHLISSVTEPSFGEFLSSATDQENVVVAGTEYCTEVDCVAPCSQRVSFQSQCGHTISNIRCSIAFQWAAGSLEAPRCDVPVDITCSPLCHHFVSSVPCWLASKLESWKPWLKEGDEQNNDALPAEFDEVQSSSEMNHSDLVVPWEFKAPNVPDFIDRNLINKYLRCTGVSVLIRPCSHILTMSCVDAFFGERPACCERVSVKCDKANCQFERLISCSVLESFRASGVPDPCVNSIEKLCNICRINKKAVACSKDIVECSRRVTSTLSCGHEASWTCGTETDPRAMDPLDCCKGCLFPLWGSIIAEGAPKNSTLTEDFVGFVRNQFQSMVEKTMADLGQTEVRFDLQKSLLLLQDLQKHLDARTRILQGYKEAMQKDNARLLLPPSSFFEKANRLVESQYDCVIKIPKSSNGTLNAIKQTFTTSSPSDYGHGAKFHILSTDSLRLIKPSATGELVFYLGIAFRFLVLAGAQPFRVPVHNGQQNNKRMKKLREQADEMANKTLRACRATGFDCVDCQVKKDGILTPTGERLYWQPGAVIPLCKVTLKLQCQCTVCMEYLPTTDGLRCNSAHHLLCWNCFHAYINSAKEPDAVGRFVDKDGNLTCPGCKAIPYSLEQISACGGSAQALEEFSNLRMQIQSDQKLKDELDKQEKRIREEYERIQRIKDADEREATKVRLDIIDQILTLRCPRCKAAFTDFSGCFALSCRCRAAFCAWCLGDCGADAHAHVARCSENRTQGNVFGSLDLFNQHHQQRRQRLVRDKFYSLPKEVQNHLKRLIARDLADLKITLD